jgi:hypothetical protein
MATWLHGRLVFEAGIQRENTHSRRECPCCGGDYYLPPEGLERMRALSDPDKRCSFCKETQKG